MNAIFAPEALIGGDGIRGEVDEDCSAFLCSVGEGLIHRCNARCDQPREGHERCEIGERETEHSRAVVDQGALHVRDIGGDGCGIESQAGDIVGAAE